MSIEPDAILSHVPEGLRKPLIDTYREIAENFAEHRWEPSELNGGKFCEVVYSILVGSLSGSYASAPSKPRDMKQACLALEQNAASSNPGDRSLRILIPRMLLPLYEVRNNRGVGHVGGDVNPNLMDATVVFSMASWILAELVRIYHAVSTAAAQETVDALSERRLPLVWSPDGSLKRVLSTQLSASDQTLLLLHQHLGWTDDDNLFKSVEYSNKSVFRNKILKLLHKQRMIEYDVSTRSAKISPKGSAFVEENIVRPYINRNAGAR